MGKYHFYFSVTWTLEHAAFNLLLQLNAKCSFSSLWLKCFGFFLFELQNTVPSEHDGTIILFSDSYYLYN